MKNLKINLDFSKHSELSCFDFLIIAYKLAYGYIIYIIKNKKTFVL